MPHCPNCGRADRAPDRGRDRRRGRWRWTAGTRVQVLAPVVRGRKGEYRKELEERRGRATCARASTARCVELDEADRARPQKQARHRGRGRPPHGRSRTRAAPRRLASRPRSRSADGRRRGRDGATAARRDLQPSGRVPELRHQRRRSSSRASSRSTRPYGACPRLHRASARSWRSTRSSSSPTRRCRSPRARSRRGAERVELRYGSTLQSLAEALRRSTSSTPWQELPGARSATSSSTGRTASGSRSRFANRVGRRRSYTTAVRGRGRRTSSAATARRSSSGRGGWIEELHDASAPCPACGGARLQAREPRGDGRRHGHPTSVTPPVGEAARSRCGRRPRRSTARERHIAEPILQGDRGAARLPRRRRARLPHARPRRGRRSSGGEAQRIRLATQIGSQLIGVLYILDEPSIGLHQRDNERLLGTLHAAARPRQHGDRGRARRARPCAPPTTSSTSGPARARTAGTWWPRARRPRSTRTRESLTGPVPRRGRAASRCRPTRRQGQRRGARGRGAPRAQPARTSTCASRSGVFDLRDRRLGLGQEHARQRHPPRALVAQRSIGHACAPGDARRASRALEHVDKVIDDRPAPDRPHAALEPRDLHGRLRLHPRPLRAACPRRRCAATGRGASRST